jgi:PHD/YefM family antitoxin component YafN of YafNO toxin-antitoxin module
MYQRIDLATTQQPVREFIQSVGETREPVDLVLNGSVVARIVPPSELSEAERQRILDEGWAVVEKARARTKDIPASAIQKAVDKGVREVRARHGQRGR